MDAQWADRFSVVLWMLSAGVVILLLKIAGGL